jgi:hypothetical protein
MNLYAQEHAKPQRESLTYCLCTHEENQLIMHEIWHIVEQHGSKKQVNQPTPCAMNTCFTLFSSPF